MVNPRSNTRPAARKVHGDYRSLVLTLDHMMVRQDDHRIQKIVMSTQGSMEALAGILHYYRDSKILASPSTLELLQEGAKSDMPVYVYTGPVNVQIIMETETYSELVRSPLFGNGSDLATTDKLCEFIAQFQQANIESRGGIVPLFVINPMTELAEKPVDPPSQE